MPACRQAGSAKRDISYSPELIPTNVEKFILNFSTSMSRERIDIGASVNGKPTVSKTVTAGSSPAAPVVLVKYYQEQKEDF